MLLELNIRNFALIEQLQLRLGSGFNVLTGETGAGKSIVIDAINAVLGERMGAEVIRTGASRCSVEGAFDLSSSPDRLQELLNSGALEPEETTLLLSREIASEGRSQCRIGGRLSSVSLLREVARNLVDIHGQHEHQSLLNVDRHLEILDHWCGPEAWSLRDECAGLDRKRRALSTELNSLRRDERDRAQRLDLLQFQADEIDSARLREGEDAELEAERRRLANMERLMTQVAQARVALNGQEPDDPSVLDALGSAVRSLADASKDDPALGAVLETVQSALYVLQDAVQEIAAYHENLETNPARLEQVDDRLALLRGLRRKYGDSIEEILALRQQVQHEIEQAEGSEERDEQLEAEIAETTAAHRESAARLTERRRAGAAELERQVAGELADLALRGARFLVQIEAREPGECGADRVEFLFSANPGEPPRPLARIASGGEMSRIMLALKALLASSVRVPTVIFDEIDAGVGGRTGEAIAEKLRALGASTQVVCVTHLPQIAAVADRHFTVRKVVAEGRTTVRVSELSEKERVEELARMLGGGQQTAERHARDLLRRRRHTPARDRPEPGDHRLAGAGSAAAGGTAVGGAAVGGVGVGGPGESTATEEFVQAVPGVKVS